MKRILIIATVLAAVWTRNPRTPVATSASW